MEAAVSIAILLTAATGDAGTDQLAELTFEVGATQLSLHDEARTERKLAMVAAWALEHPGGLVVVDGHGDGRGGAAVNAQLSLSRAQAVRDELEAEGVNPDQIVLAAFDGTNARRSVVIWGMRADLDGDGSEVLR